MDPLLSEHLFKASLVFARILPLVALTPIFGGEVAPRRFRIGAALFLAIACAGFARAEGGFSGLELVPVYAGEVLVGLTLAIFVKLVFETFATMGALADVARGATLSEILDPSSRVASSALGAAASLLALVIFCAIDGHHVVLAAVAESYRTAPAGMAHDLGVADTALALLRVVAELFLLAVELAAPVIVVLLVVDLALALVNRAAAQIPVFFLGTTVKGLIGLGVVWFALGLGFERVLASMLERLVALASGR